APAGNPAGGRRPGPVRPSSTTGRGRARAGDEYGPEAERRWRSVLRASGSVLLFSQVGRPGEAERIGSPQLLVPAAVVSRAVNSAKRLRSILPPDTIATILPVPARPLSAAATAQAPAPSATTCVRSAVRRMAALMSASGMTMDPS